MYFLNGDRIYIKPEKVCETLDGQLQNCLQQLKKINSGKKVFKLNFFVDTISDEDYLKLQQKVQLQLADLFAGEIVRSIIAQPPLTCKIIVEAFYYDSSLWEAKFVSNGNNGATLFKRGNSERGNVARNSESYS